MTDEGNTCALTAYPIVSRLLEISLFAVICVKPPASVCGVKVSHTCSRLSCQNRRNLLSDVAEAPQASSGPKKNKKRYHPIRRTAAVLSGSSVSGYDLIILLVNLTVPQELKALASA